MAGVRLGDGTTWVKSRGFSWVLGSYMAAKLYPQGAPPLGWPQAAPATRRWGAAGAHVPNRPCLADVRP